MEENNFLQNLVFVQLADKLTAAADSARRMKAENENFERLAAYLEKMILITNDLQQSASSNEVIDILETCCKDVDKAYQLITLCKNESRMYLLTHSRTVVDKLENITHGLGRTLGLIPVSQLVGHEEIKAAIECLSHEMQIVQFRVKLCEDHISSALERGSSNIRSEIAVQTSILRDKTRTASVDDVGGNEIELARIGIEVSENSRRVNLVGNIFDNWVERQAQLSPIKEAPHRGPIHLDEPFDSFFCPLLNTIMVEPVSIETGRTYERTAIEEWFKQCLDEGRPLICPASQMKVDSTTTKPNIALRHTIEQWATRNEALHLKHALALLQHGVPEADIITGMQDIQVLCYQNMINKVKTRSAISSIAELLKYSMQSENGRCIAFKTLQILAEDDDEMKELIGKTTAIYSAVKSLSRELSQETVAALSFLEELSTSPSLCGIIGSNNGAILILIGLVGNQSESLAQKAQHTLQNLERCDQNIKQMAENGMLNPLIRRLHEGPEDVRADMASHISEIPLSNEGKTMLAKEGLNELVTMLRSKKLIVQEAALQALSTLSDLESNGKLLVDAGVLQPLMKDLLIASRAPAKLKEIAATVVANVVSSGTGWESVQIDKNGHTLTSEQVVHHLLHVISNQRPSIQAKLLQVLMGFASSPVEVINIVKHIKTAGAIVSLIQFLEAPQKDLVMISLRLLNCLSPHMGQELADGLRISTHQLGTLVSLVGNNDQSMEIAAYAAGILANLPVMDFQLTSALRHAGILPIILRRIQEVGHMAPRIRTKSFISKLQEGLVGVLARFTFNLEDPDILEIAMDYDLAFLFKSFLNTIHLDEVQRWSAIALQNLSKKSKYLVDRKQVPVQTVCERLCPFVFQTKDTVNLCSVHGGICTIKETFCLIEANALEPLVACLESRNIQVVDAAINALSTLIQGPVDVEAGLKELQKAGMVHPVITILQQHRNEHLRERATWILERFLQNKDTAKEAATNPDVCSSLVDVFRHGGYHSRKHAESCLMHLDKIPKSSSEVLRTTRHR